MTAAMNVIWFEAMLKDEMPDCRKDHSSNAKCAYYISEAATLTRPLNLEQRPLGNVLLVDTRALGNYRRPNVRTTPQRQNKQTFR